MELVPDLDQMRSFAEQKSEENWRFRTYLKNAEIADETLDALVHEIYEEVAGQIDCTACGNCCRAVRPVVAEDDVERLAGHLSASAEEVVEQYLDPDEHDGGDFRFRQEPCPFLTGNECSVYSGRPDACRSYPHLHKDEVWSRLWGIVQNCGICPIVFNVYEELKAEFVNEDGETWEDDEMWDLFDWH